MASTEKLIVELSAKVEDYNLAIKQSMDKTQTETNKGKKAFDEVEGSVVKFRKNAGKALAAFAAVTGAVFATREILQYTDAFTNLQNKIRTVLKPTEDLGTVTHNLLKLSNDTRASLESTTTLYTRLSRSTQDLGLSSEELYSVTETINKGFALSGATAEEAAAAITQLSQGLASGALRGDEFNSVAEQAPIILEAVAAATGKSRGELRDLAADGAITADVLIKSLQSYSKVIDMEFSQTNTTFEAAQQRLNDNFTIMIGELDKLINFSGNSVAAVEGLSNGLTVLSSTLVDSIQYIKNIGTIVSDELGPKFERLGGDVETLSSQFETELSYVQDLFNAFVFALRTGLLVIPRTLSGVYEGAISGLTYLFTEAKIQLLSLQEMWESNFGDDAIAESLRNQINSLEESNKRAMTNMGDEFTSFIDEIANVNRDYDERMRQLDAEAAEERQRQRDKELEDIKEFAAAKTEALAETGGTVDLPDTAKPENNDDIIKSKLKEIDTEERLKRSRIDNYKIGAQLVDALGKKSKTAAVAAFVIQQGLAAAEVVVSTQAASMRALAELGPIAGAPVAAAIQAKGALSLGVIAATSARGVAGMTSGGGGGGGISGGGGASITTRDIPQERLGVTTDVAGSGGMSSQLITITAPPGDSIGEALADWINDGIRKGRIEGAKG